MADKKTASKQKAARARPDGVVTQGGMARNLGIRLISVTKKKVIAEMPVKPRHLNRSKRVHGGALMAFADALGATGTVANLPPGHRTTTLESKTNFFAAGEGPVLPGRARWSSIASSRARSSARRCSAPTAAACSSRGRSRPDRRPPVASPTGRRFPSRRSRRQRRGSALTPRPACTAR